MTGKRKIATVTAGDADAEHFEKMPIAEIGLVLRDAGIDPQPTIDAVMQLVGERLRRRDRAAKDPARVPS